MARTIADALNELVNGEPNGLKPQINKKAPIDSPALTGTPTAPTPAEGDNSTKLATTAFVQNVVNKLLSFADSDLDTFAEVIDEIKAMRSAQASSTDFGMVKVGSNINVVDGTISLTKSNVVNALGYTPPTTAGSSTLYSSTGSATDGAMTQAATTAALANKLDATASAASAATASKVTGGTIQLTGSVTGSGSFNSSGNVTINTSGGGTTYSTGTASTAGITKLYTSTGSSIDGTMTRQAITNELNNKATTSALNSLQSTVNNKANSSDLNNKLDKSTWDEHFSIDNNGLHIKDGVACIDGGILLLDSVAISNGVVTNRIVSAIPSQGGNIWMQSNGVKYAFNTDGIYLNNKKITN